MERKSRTDRVEFYLDKTLKHRWRYVSANGNIMADSGQGYVRRRDAKSAAKRVTGKSLRRVKFVDSL